LETLENRGNPQKVTAKVAQFFTSKSALKSRPGITFIEAFPPLQCFELEKD
jgi:hypothetical protein